MGISVESTEWLFSPLSTRSTGILTYWFLCRKKNPRSKDENQQQTNPTYDAETGIEPGPHWWETSALTTAPSLHPLLEVIASSYQAVPCFHFMIPTGFWSVFAIFNNSSGSYNNLLNREHGLSFIN